MMQSDGTPKSELRVLVFLTLAKCGHAYNLIQEAQSEDDIPRIVGQLKMIEDQTQDIQQQITRYRINDSDVQDKLYAIIDVTKNNIKPGINALKFKAGFATAKALFDEWGPRIDTALSILEKTVKLAAEYRKQK